ncbi:hypothetical protein GCM10026988_20910 [Vibrio panuliri]
MTWSSTSATLIILNTKLQQYTNENELNTNWRVIGDNPLAPFDIESSIRTDNDTKLTELI